MGGRWQRVPKATWVLFWIWTGLLVAMESLVFFTAPAWNNHNDVLDGTSGTAFFFLSTLLLAVLWAIGIAILAIAAWLWWIVRRPY